VDLRKMSRAWSIAKSKVKTTLLPQRSSHLAEARFKVGESLISNAKRSRFEGTGSFKGLHTAFGIHQERNGDLKIGCQEQ